MSKDTEHIFERLRNGLVPQRGLDTFGVGIEKPRTEMHRQLKLVAGGEGNFKFLRGGYGCGKTFMSRLVQLDALDKGFATSFVVVSDNDLHFHRFDDVYRKVMQELCTPYCPRAALSDILDRWIGGVEEALVAGGADDSAPDFDAKVSRRLEENLQSATGGAVPDDMVRALRAIFELKQAGQLTEAGALLSWLGGSTNVSAEAKKKALLRGEVGSRDALVYLRGIVEIVKAAGYAGLVIVIDEVETILRMRRDIRGKSLNGIRQIIDASANFPGLLWVFTGTPEFFDTQRGVAGLAPLHDRIRFQNSGDHTTLRQAQVDLKPFNAGRLRDVALRLKELYPAEEPTRVQRKITGPVVDALVARVTEGFRGDVGVVPRQFLRLFVKMLDQVDEFDDYDPVEGEGLELVEVTEDERRLQAGEAMFDDEPDDAGVYETVEF